MMGIIIFLKLFIFLIKKISLNLEQQIWSYREQQNDNSLKTGL